MSDDNSRVTTMLNTTIDDTNQITLTEEILSESDEEEDHPFNSLSTCVFDGRTIHFVSKIINGMVSMKNNL